MTRNFTSGFCVIVNAPQVVAVQHRRERAIERQNFQTVSRQIELANDLRAQQGNDVGANRKLEAGKNFFRYRGAAKHVSSLKYQHALARARQVSGIDQSVVTATNNNDVIFVFSSLTQRMSPKYAVHE